MYEKHFGIEAKPFSIAPDPNFLYMSGGHREALAHLRYGLENEGGFVLLTGEVGTGKTTVCRCLLEQIPANADIAFILNPKVTSLELLESICDELAITRPFEASSVKTVVDLINTHLLSVHASGRRTVLIIDEAQNLDSEVLEQIRLLTNLETNKQKLLQIILLGQPELQVKLNTPELRQLNQRISARHHLGPLSRKETKSYIIHRLSVAGLNKQIFLDESIDKIFQLSEGVPRLINMIADRSLLGAYTKGQRQIDKKLVLQACQEVFGEKNRKASPLWTTPAWQIALWTAIAIFLLILAIKFVSDNDDNSPKSVAGERPSSISSQGNDETIRAVEREAISDKNVLQALPWPIDGKKTFDENDAFRHLFALWGIKLPQKVEWPCQFAERHGLLCISKQGSIETLIQMNRPSLLVMRDKDDKEFYLVLKSLTNGRAQALVSEEIFSIDLKTLAFYWSGQYILLWKPPPGYHGSIRPGDQGKDVAWLAQQIALIYGEDSISQESAIFDETLVDKIKLFQFNNGLVPDGIAGKETLIMIKNSVDNLVPMLQKKNSNL